MAKSHDHLKDERIVKRQKLLYACLNGVQRHINTYRWFIAFLPMPPISYGHNCKLSRASALVYWLGWPGQMSTQVQVQMNGNKRDVTQKASRLPWQYTVKAIIYRYSRVHNSAWEVQLSVPLWRTVTAVTVQMWRQPIKCFELSVQWHRESEVTDRACCASLAKQSDLPSTSSTSDAQLMRCTSASWDRTVTRE